MLKTVCIVIPTFNRASFLEKLLICIRNQEISEDIRIITTVSVDGSTDNTYEMLEKHFPEVLVVKGTGNWWFTRSLNEGCKRGLQENPDYFLLLNDDCEVRPDFVQNLLKDHATLPQNSIIGTITRDIKRPQIVTFSGVKNIKWYRYKSYKYHPPFFDSSLEELSGIKTTCFLNARGSLIPTATFRKLDFYDNYFEQYLSDSDFSYRALKEKIPLYISWNVPVYDHIDETAAGAPYRKQSFFHYLKQYSNKYSPNYLPFHWKIIRRNVAFPIRPLTMLIYLLATTRAYFKYRLKYRTHG